MLPEWSLGYSQGPCGQAKQEFTMELRWETSQKEL